MNILQLLKLHVKMVGTLKISNVLVEELEPQHTDMFENIKTNNLYISTNGFMS